MDATLVTVTVLSMTMAAALSAIVWRMLRLERQRSNARVAALSAVALSGARSAPGHVAQASKADAAVLPLIAGDGETKGASTPNRMFVEHPRESPWRARLAVMTALALVVASGVLFTLAAHASKTHAARGAAAANVSQASASPAAAQLELMSLHDSRQAGSLTITGLVQNPRTGVHLSRVAVTAYTFDARGSVVASGRALLDVTALAPGDESAFTVTMRVSDNVARYRIGFRDETGRVIAHVDRRQGGPVASNW